MFGRFTSQERTNVHRTAFFFTPVISHLKVVWGKDTSRRSKRVEATFPRVSRRGRHLANVDDVIIYPDLVVARTVVYISQTTRANFFKISSHNLHNVKSLEVLG